MEIFYKNCIISGEVDYYCLLCRKAFTKQNQLPKHIEKMNHKNKLKSLTYLKKFQQHKICKIDHIYYCKVCSEVINTPSSLRDHVQEDKHKANIKVNELPLESSEDRVKLVKRQDFESVLVCDLKLNNSQWHSIIGNSCRLCDKVVPNIIEIIEHTHSINHMVRLIQSKCHIYNTENMEYFRKINEEKFYCFVCEKTSPMSSLNTHWEEKEHVDSLTSPSSKSSLESQMQYYNVEKDSSRAMDIFQKVCPGVLIQRAYPRRISLENFPGKVVKHGNKYKVVPWHMCEPEDLSEPNPIDTDMAKFLKENFMKMTHFGHRAFCLLCKEHIPITNKNFLVHILGLRHQGFLQIKGHVEWYIQEKEPTICFTYSEYVEHLFPLPSKESLIINRLYLLDVLSFNMMIRIDMDIHIKKAFCNVCDIYLCEDEVNEHIKDETHKQKCDDVKVIADFDNEFIRKIQDFGYHCGFCNELWSTYESIDSHVSSREHRKEKQFHVLPQGYSKILKDNATEDQINEHLEQFYENPYKVQNF